MATIATHNGSKAHRAHNIRDPKVTKSQPHINPDGVHETWHDEEIRDAYKRLFGEAMEEYNAKQFREERQIKDYYDHICEDAKKHPAYEMIVGVYGEDCSPELGREILKAFVAGWQQRNPQLEMIGAYYHADEPGDPHVHIDYIPVAHGYKRGMETQNGLDKALRQMGFVTASKTQTAQIAWERRENEHLEKLCKARNLNVEHPKSENKKHMDTELYKATQELQKTRSAIEGAKNELEDLQKPKGRIGYVGPLKRKIDDLEASIALQEHHIDMLEATLEARNIQVSDLLAEKERQKELKPEIDDLIAQADSVAKCEALERENSRLRQLIETIKNFIQEHFPEVYAAIEKFFVHEKER